MFTDVIILAGGFGERLWPASKPDFPKQFLSLGSDLSLLQNAIKRALALNIKGKIIIATRKDLEQGCVEQAKDLTQKVTEEQKQKILNDLIVLPEPCARHTTAPIILSCHLLQKLVPNVEHSVLVLTSDHIIKPIEAFISDVKKAYNVAIKENFVCFAINPTEASTGFGYIKAGEEIDCDTFKIENFKEKPNKQTAQEYLSSGNYFWNSGMFGFTARFIQNELLELQKDISTSFLCVQNGSPPQIVLNKEINVVKKWDEMDKAYKTVRAIAIDKSIAEKTKNAVVVRASFEWDDVGTWDAFAKFSSGKDNVVAKVDSEKNFVYSDIPVTLCGVNNLIVVIKNGKALIMKKGKSSLMSDAVKIMKENNGE